MNNPRALVGGELKYTAAGELVSQELQVSIVVVLRAMAEADSGMGSTELTSIVMDLAIAFDIREVEVGELLEVAQVVGTAPEKVHTCLKRIREGFSPEAVEHFMVLMWKVISADNRAAAAETSLAVIVRQELGLTLEQAARARAIAEQEIKLKPGHVSKPVEEDIDDEV